MIEERINISDIVQHEGCRIRWNSTGKICSLSNGGMKTFSRYLRPSLGSCHDFCKYGVERALEIKASGPMSMSKGVTETLAEGHDLERTQTSAERKKNLSVRLRSFAGSKTKKLDVPIVNRIVASWTTEETILSDQVSSSPKEIDLSVKHASDPKKKTKRPKKSSFRMQRCSNGEGQGEVNIRKSKETENISENSLEVSSGRRKSKTKIRSKEMRTVKGERKLLTQPSISLSYKHSLKRISSQNAEISNNVKIVSHLSNQKNVRKPKPEKSSTLEVPEKTLHAVFETNAEDTTATTETNAEEKSRIPIRMETDVAGMSQLSSLSPEIKRCKGAQDGSHTAKLSKFTEKRNLRHSQNRIHATQSPPSYSCPPSPKKKGLRCALLGTRIAQSYASSLASFSTDSGASSAHDKTDTGNRTTDLKDKYNNRPRKVTTISLNDKCYPGQKITFRRGKVVDLLPEDNAPRRLKFRRRESMLGNSQNDNGDASRKTFGKKEPNTAFIPPFSEEQDLRRSQYRIQTPQSRLSWPTSPMKKGLRTARRGTVAPWSKHGETAAENQISDLEKEDKNMHELDGTTSLKEECDPGQKSTNLQSEDSISSPRKLKFMQRGRMLDDKKQKGDVSMKTLSKKVANHGAAKVTKTEAKNIVLRHQNMGEKNSGSLLNNVIEETVSELVKSRKSNVKALVGAFETVISLQDTKPLVTSTAS